MNRPLAAILAPAIILLAVIGASCGGDSDRDDDSTPTAVGTARSGAPPPQATSGGGATNTAAPNTPAPTPEPTTPPETPTPEDTSLRFETPDAGNGSKSGTSQGPLGAVYADAAFGVLLPQNRAQASAFINLGINERPSASAWLTNNFRVPGDGTTPVTTQISTGVNWQGVLAGNGLGGTRAAVTISLSVVSNGNVIASEEVHSLEHRESALTLGGFDDIDRADVDMQVALVPGVYELRLTVTCDASSGLLGAATHCVYGPSEVYDDGFVAWEPRTIIFVP